ncbi:MAG: lipoyl-dependent peroxiredoxin [Gaiellaceae bacterium]|jgi:hypothetical protein|nr:lipoyl-dependent peroxiredoxin [Gaiellaceae bacterium]
MATQVNTTMAGQLKSVLDTAEAPVEGGREGHGRTRDGRLDVELSVPAVMSGDDGPGTNPEQLFAVGYLLPVNGHRDRAKPRARRDRLTNRPQGSVSVRSTLAASVYNSRLTYTHRASPLKRRAS